VIGKAHRLHLPSRPSPIQRQMGERRQRTRPTAMRPAAMRVAPVESVRAAPPPPVIAKAPAPPPPKNFRSGPIDSSSA
jgi:GcrA cell cycle regulator